MAEQIHVNDIGTAFMATVKDEQGEIIDLTTLVSARMWFQRPDQSTFERTAETYGPPADGVIVYVTEANDLDAAGSWKLQGVVEFADGKWHSDIHKFKVWPNLRSS